MCESVEGKLPPHHSERFERRDALNLVVIVALYDFFKFFVLPKHIWQMIQKPGATTKVIILSSRYFDWISKRKILTHCDLIISIYWRSLFF